MNLVEILVSMSIMTAALTAVMPSFNSIQHKGKVMKARIEVASIQTAANMYYMDKNTYPTSLNQLTAGGVDAYIKVIPKDPWNHNYALVNNQVTSYGADGQPGGTGRDADIVSQNNL